ncbi:MAG: hypothetical protein IJT54_04350 [Candidatus Methanomethylophilaceae archaeon]|nr:hypothetical protein [Candidatus Methanomethylophilaceae archaeon]
MKCPKCGRESEEGDIFCQGCDWQLNKPYKESIDPVNKIVIISFAALIFGTAALIVSLLGFGIYGVVFGAIGLVASSFGQTFVRASGFEGQQRKVFFIITTVALIVSICGFIFGIFKL